LSVITAVKKNSEICVCADGQTNFGSTIVDGRHLVNYHKIYQVNDSLIGLVGWHAMSIIVEHLIANRAEMFKLDSRLEIYNTLLKLHNILKDEYFIEIADDEDGRPVESNQLSGLIANKHGLFKIDSYREVYEFTDFWATGSGYRYALGAMHSLFEKDFSAREIAEAGVKASIEYHDACGMPIQSEVVRLNDA